MKLLAIALFIAISGTVLVPTSLRGNDDWRLRVCNESSSAFKFGHIRTEPDPSVEDGEYTHMFTLQPGVEKDFEFSFGVGASFSIKCMKNFPITKDEADEWLKENPSMPKNWFDNGKYSTVLTAKFDLIRLLYTTKKTIQLTGALIVRNDKACWALAETDEGDDRHDTATMVLEERDTHLFYREEKFDLHGKGEPPSPKTEGEDGIDEGKKSPSAL
jgi:hypothetical protein